MIPLWCKSNFSFLEGSSHPEELVEEAQKLGLAALALTDRDGVYGAVAAHRAATELGMKVVHGSQVTLEGNRELLLLVQDASGWRSLCRLLTVGRLRCPKGQSRVTVEEVAAHADGLLAIALDSTPLEGLVEAYRGRLSVLVARHRLEGEGRREARARARAARFALPVVAATEVLYASRERRLLQDVVTSIRHALPLAAAGRRLRPNAEHGLKGSEEIQTLFSDDPAALACARELAERCTFSLAQLRYRYPAEQLPTGLTSDQWLRQLVFEGARWRYPASARVPPAVSELLEKELRIIEQLDYSGYFLTMYEIVRFCQEQKIVCQGRGSAANSAVCYCLGITAVDPVRMGLLFERFLSVERAEPPDIDLDIMHQRREEVIQFVYDRYGRDRAAMVANVVRYRPRSAVRDVGKALGLEPTALDRMARLLSRERSITPELATHAGFDLEAPGVRLWLRLSNELLDSPRHLSIHPGGFMLGHQPVCDLVPIENATMPGRTVIQWDKNDIDSLGLFKLDLLGLGALSQIDRCFGLLRQHRGVEMTLATVPKEDPATYEMLQKADTVGIFQIESRAQMSMLPRLKPTTYYDLVIQISIVRPGPITGGMVHPYLRRRNKEEAVDYPHESLVPVLQKTLGIPLFQEQVMKLAMIAADYTPGEADQLRRDMGAWKSHGRLEKHRQRLIERMTSKGIAIEFAERVYRQIQGFGDYGFPESHAASFALISYAASYLKCHYPAEFLCSILNSQPMGFYSVASLVDDARRSGVDVRPIDVRFSDWDCTLEPVGRGFAVRMGLRNVKGLEKGEGQRLEQLRPETPDTMEKLARRADLSRKALAALASAGALSCYGNSRRQRVWQAHGLSRERRAWLDAGVLTGWNDGPEQPVALAPLEPFETIAWDYRASSHSVRGHPLGPLRGELRQHGLLPASEILRTASGRSLRYAGLVICRQQPDTASGVIFMTLADETGVVNVVVWPKVAQAYWLLLKTHSFLGVTGRLESEQGVTHLIARELWAPPVRLDGVKVESHDFH